MNNRSLKKWIKECIKQALTENFREPPKVDRVLQDITISQWEDKVESEALKDIVRVILTTAEGLKDLTKANPPTPAQIRGIKNSIRELTSSLSFMMMKKIELTKELSTKIDEALQGINNKLDDRKDPNSLEDAAFETHTDLVKLASIIVDNQKESVIKLVGLPHTPWFPKSPSVS